jgi:Type I site-specific restriction-modification system, R (restriction) subunit and related helicases
MRGHGLMQAIARVNRVFKDKPGGLVVDYLGLADELKQALATYTESGGMGKTAIDQAEAVALMQEKYEVCRGLMHGFDWARWTTGTPQERLSLLPAAQEHVLTQEDGKNRFHASLNSLRRLPFQFLTTKQYVSAMMSVFSRRCARFWLKTSRESARRRRTRSRNQADYFQGRYFR